MKSDLKKQSTLLTVTPFICFALAALIYCLTPWVGRATQPDPAPDYVMVLTSAPLLHNTYDPSDTDYVQHTMLASICTDLSSPGSTVGVGWYWEVGEIALLSGHAYTNLGVGYVLPEHPVQNLHQTVILTMFGETPVINWGAGSQDSLLWEETLGHGFLTIDLGFGKFTVQHDYTWLWSQTHNIEEEYTFEAIRRDQLHLRFPDLYDPPADQE